jgi:hypothetical protein
MVPVIQLLTSSFPSDDKNFQINQGVPSTTPKNNNNGHDFHTRLCDFLDESLVIDLISFQTSSTLAELRKPSRIMMFFAKS